MGYQINQNIILTGDLNSDLFSSRNNKLIDTMNLFNLTNVFEKPTRITEHSSTLLDPIIISDYVPVTILVGIHFLATLRNVSVKLLHISSTSSKSESNAFQSTVSSLQTIKQSDIDKYKKQRNKVNNLKKTAKEHFEQNLDTLIFLKIYQIQKLTGK
jgi:hypothetical protein